MYRGLGYRGKHSTEEITSAIVGCKAPVALAAGDRSYDPGVRFWKRATIRRTSSGFDA